MQIAFGLLTAKEPLRAVAELVSTLGDHDPIIVHHDYSKQSDFRLPGTAAYIIRDFVETGWGAPGLPRAIFRLIATALEQTDFDYFQLLSGACLPLRPVGELREHLERDGEPIYADLLDLDRDERVMMSHGHRVFCRSEKLAARLLGRSRRWYLGDDPITIQQANLGIHDRHDSGAALNSLQWLGKQVHVAARAGLLDTHPFHDGMTPYVGSLWFCLRRDVCEYLVRQESNNPALPYLFGLQVCDEILFPTLLGNSGFGSARSNHLVNEFVGSHPRVFDAGDRAALAASNRFFARKFSTDRDDPMRRLQLDHLLCREDQQLASLA